MEKCGSQICGNPGNDQVRPLSNTGSCLSYKMGYHEDQICESSSVRYLLLRRQHNDILPLTARKLQQILIPQLDIASRLDLLAIKLRPITTLQIDDIRLHPPLCLPYSILVLCSLHNVSELDGGMLLRGAGMLEHNVGNLVRFPQEPARLRVELHRVDHVLALEDE